MIISRPTSKIVLPLGDPADTDRTMRVTQPYKPGVHEALDIGNYHGGDVLVAVADATVIAVGYVAGEWSDPKPSDAWWYSQPLTGTGQRGGLYGPPSAWAGPTWGGRMVVLDLGGGWVASYAHLATVEVTVGQRVARGARLGTIGDSGSSYRQPHLHFGLRFAGAWVDPWPLINGGAHPHQEDDVTIPGKFLRHVQNRRAVLTDDAHFRRGVISGADASYGVMPKGTVLYPVFVVEGRSAGTAADRLEWYAAVLWVSAEQAKAVGSTETGHLLGFVHSSVLPRVDGKVSLEAIEVVPDPDAAAKVAAAEAEASEARAHLAQAAVHAGAIATKAAAAEKAAGEAADAAVAIQQLAK